MRVTTKGGPSLVLFALGLAAALGLTGCSPPGQRALLEGRRLAAAGEWTQALEQLQRATAWLPTNALAWHELGTVSQRLGRAAEAEKAYRQALALNPNLAEARFNLGVLWLEQGRPALARDQFTAYTLQRPNAIEGWLQLGVAHLRLGEAAAAEASFQRVLRLATNHPAAFNGLGLAAVQRQRPRDAAQWFQAALRQQPDYRPALLNLAIVQHRYLNEPTQAAQTYRRYLEVAPDSTNRAAVTTILQTLEAHLAAATKAPTPVPQPSPATNALAGAPAPREPPPQTLRTAAPVAVARTTPPPAAPTPATPPPPATVVQLPPEPPIRTEPEHGAPPPSPPATPPAATPQAGAPAASGVDESPPAKRSFWARLNPFSRERSRSAVPRSESKSAPRVTPLPGDTARPAPPPLLAPPGPQPATSAPPPQLRPVTPPTVARYPYLSPPTPTPGNREAAESAFARGRQLHRAGRLAEAAAAYRQAVEADPSHFEAQFNLGLVTFELRNYRQSLAAWEHALAVKPDSVDARYNFALALKAADYPLDAARELERVLAQNTNETRAHLVLGNLYAGPLRDAKRARAHYLRVLELDPRHPQAGAIRFWLAENPG